VDTTAAKAATELLVRHWKEGNTLAALPQTLRPTTRAEAYAAQAHLEAHSQQPLFGWKIAATSVAGQKHINVDGPIAGRLLAEMVFHDGATVPFGANRMRVAEAEFAFCMGRDLPPRATPYAMHEVLDAVSALYLAIEIPDSRYTDYVKVGAPQLIADNACGHQFVLGPKAPDMWRELDLAAHRVMGHVGHVGQRLQREGIGANVLGDPRLALTWLANELPSMGATLAAGHIVTTGTCVVPMDIVPLDTVLMDFGVLGQVRCGFSGG
jgi:2-keto-4-pentenoate hydratase